MPFQDLRAVRVPGFSTSHNLTLPAVPPAGCVMVIGVLRSNGNNGPGSYVHATAPGFTEPTGGHYDPPGNFDMFGTFLTKVADGNETSITISWAGAEPGSESIQNVFYAVACDVKPSSIQVNWEAQFQDPLDYAPDLLDENLHFYSNQGSTDVSGAAFPATDPVAVFTAPGFRAGGLAVSGGGSTSEPIGSNNNITTGTISFAECVFEESDPITFTMIDNSGMVQLADDSHVGVVGVSVSENVFTNDPDMGTAPTVCSFTGGTVPPGLTFNAATGLLSGIPTLAGIYNFIYECTDSLGNTDTAIVNCVISEAPPEVVLADDVHTGTAGIPVNVSVYANDPSGGTAPLTCSLTSGTPPPGTTFDAASGILSGVPTTAGTFAFSYTCSDANDLSDTATVTCVIDELSEPTPNNTCREIALHFVINPEGIDPTADCKDNLPCIVDGTGSSYPLGFDSNDNVCIVIPDRDQPKNPVIYTSGAGESPDITCCVTNAHIGTPAFDLTRECVTHICMGPNLGFQPICADADGPTTTPPTDPDSDQVCYDFDSADYPLTYGGADAAWFVQGVNRLPQQPCQPTMNMFSAFEVLYTCDYTNQSVLDDPANILGYNLTDTDVTVVDFAALCPPNNAQPAQLVLFEAPTNHTPGPVTATFEITQALSAFNFAVFNRCEERYEPIASFTGPTGANAFLTNGGNALVIGTASGNELGAYNIELVDQAIDPSCIEYVFLGVGGSTDSERIENIGMLHQEPAEQECCQEILDVTDLAAFLTNIGPLGSTWTAVGTMVCASLPVGLATLFSDLEFCDASSIPTFTSS